MAKTQNSQRRDQEETYMALLLVGFLGPVFTVPVHLDLQSFYFDLDLNWSLLFFFYRATQTVGA
jgi:hypothetical protein